MVNYNCKQTKIKVPQMRTNTKERGTTMNNFTNSVFKGGAAHAVSE